MRKLLSMITYFSSAICVAIGILMMLGKLKLSSYTNGFAWFAYGLSAFIYLAAEKATQQ